jgi:hypothetical protein
MGTIPIAGCKFCMTICHLCSIEFNALDTKEAYPSRKDQIHSQFSDNL